MPKFYSDFPKTPGVYIMKNRHGEVLYVGKAGNLRRRVTSYFTRPHDGRIQKLVSEIAAIDYVTTDTAIEALIREAALIKKLLPPYNIKDKDNRSFLFIEITRERFPRLLLVRGNSLAEGARFGPFTSARSLRNAMKILRKIFPWSTHPPDYVVDPASTGKKIKRPCFDYEIGLCPGTCAGLIGRAEYLRIIKNLKLFFEGKKQRVIKSFTTEMKTASKQLEFERAEKLRRRIFALKHIRDVALIGENEIVMPNEARPFRIEGYDISNISGTSAVGSMVVFIDGRPAKDQYRKFKIQTITEPNDVGMLKEVLRRRFNNAWPLPDIILVDGGKPQVNAAKVVLNVSGLKIPVIGMAKGPERKRTDIIGFAPKNINKKTLIRVRDEAHRFAISYHKKVRGRKFLE